MTAALMR